MVWESYVPGLKGEIRGRRYDVSGTAIGAEFVVNTITLNSQQQPSVGHASDGRFVATWSGPGTSNYDIFVQRFDGNPIGGEFVANTYRDGSQTRPDIAVEANGNYFVVVWWDNNGYDGNGYGIFGKRFDASGNGLGSEFAVNTYTTGTQDSPSVSVSPTGGFVVVWRSQGGDGAGYATMARRYNASGNAVGNDFVVSTYTTGNQVGGQVAHDVGGNFVITWQSDQGGNMSDIFAQRFNSSGARRGAEFRVNTYTGDNQTGASVASDSAGNFVVAWESNTQDGSNLGIFAQRFVLSDLIFKDGFES